jgi:hypothetical protein
MNIKQEEALYDFLDNVAGAFTLDEAVTYIRMIESWRAARLAEETEAFINARKLAFAAGDRRWVGRRAFFEPLAFVISPTRLELANGILIPGHRCVPFANSNLLPHEYTFVWEGSPIASTSSEGPPGDFYRYYQIYGEEYAPQYVARDNPENEEAFIEDPYEDPPEVSVTTLDMRGIYRETSFVPGDRFVVHTLDWKEGRFKLEKATKDDWGKEDLRAWFEAAENGFAESFGRLGPGSSTEEQIAYAYWYGGSRMGEVPACALEDFLFEKTDRIEVVEYGIETRFWYAGREIPDHKELYTGNMRPDRLPVEDLFYKNKLPVSEYVIHSYVWDFLYRGEEDAGLIIKRLIPADVELDDMDMDFLEGYIDSVLEEFREAYSPFTDKAIGPVRQRAGELHTAVIELAFRLLNGDIDVSWLPRHTFIILSQIQNHTACVMEDLDSDETPPETELEAIDGSLDSMIETYEDMKELIENATDSFRRNKLAVVHGGRNSGTVIERLLQLSIGGIDVWRRIIVEESCTLGKLHHIIQTVFGWRNSQIFRFGAGRASEKKPAGAGGFRGDSSAPSILEFPGNDRPLDLNTQIKALEEENIVDLLYEYGPKWTVRIMVLSRYDTPEGRPVRCVAGAGAAPPEFINGPLKFKRALTALESGNDSERYGAREELGIEFNPDEFDLEACNRSLNSNLFIKERVRDR